MMFNFNLGSAYAIDGMLSILRKNMFQIRSTSHCVFIK